MATLDQTDSSSTTLDEITRCHNLAVSVLQTVKARNIDQPPRTGPMFPISQAASLVGRSASAIRMAEAEMRLPPHDRNEFGRRQGYSLRELDNMRTVFETKPNRADTDPTAIIACQNFKGGVGKSTISVHMAQYLAVRGYRVLLIDADAQASTTMMFGYIPDQDLDELDTIYPLLSVDPPRTMGELIRKTHYHNLDLIPANLKLYNAEYELAARIPKHGFGVLGALGKQIQSVADNYDVIIMDPPPALGMVSLSVLYAANALVIPLPPSIIDFASTTSFLGMLKDTMNTLGEYDMRPDYGFIRMILSKCEPNQAHEQIADAVNQVFGRMVFDTPIRSSAEFGNASARLQSVYDLTSTTTNHAVRQRCLTQLNSAGRELEDDIISLWPSKSKIAE